MTIDMTDTIEPKSDQMNADDLMTGPRTFTIKSVRKVGGEQPVDVVLVEFPEGRPFKPSKSMRRVMVAAWGPDAATYVGKRFTLYREPKVLWAGQEIGGIRISHMSDLKSKLTVALTMNSKQRAAFVVQPLPAETESSPIVSDDLLTELVLTFERKGIPEDSRLAGVNQITGGSATDLEVITEAQARQVLVALESRPDAEVPS